MRYGDQPKPRISIQLRRRSWFDELVETEIVAEYRFTQKKDEKYKVD